MAPQVAFPGTGAKGTILQTAALCIGPHNRQVKIYQVCIVHGVSFAKINAVGVVANRARGSHIHNMVMVFWKALITQDALTAVTFIA